MDFIRLMMHFERQRQAVELEQPGSSYIPPPGPEEKVNFIVLTFETEREFALARLIFGSDIQSGVKEFNTRIYFLLVTLRRVRHKMDTNDPSLPYIQIPDLPVEDLASLRNQLDEAINRIVMASEGKTHYLLY